MAKLKDRLLYGDPVVRPVIEQAAVEDEESVDGNYGVGKLGDEVVISLGPIPPFRVPKETAIKLAALLLKQAGCDVVVNSVDRRMTASWGKLDG